MTLFVIGGASRAGKSTLCRRLHEATRYPYFHLDGIFNGVRRGFEDLPPEKVKEYTYTIVPGLVKSLISHGHSYIVEGGWIRPKTAAEILASRKKMDIRTIYIGFPDADPQKKIAQILHFNDTQEDWLARKPPDVIAKHVGDQIAASAWFRDQCREYGIRFCDTSHDFDAAIDEAVRLLMTAGLWPNACGRGARTSPGRRGRGFPPPGPTPGEQSRPPSSPGRDPPDVPAAADRGGLETLPKRPS